MKRDAQLLIAWLIIAQFMSATANAHEFWIEPDTFRPEANGLVKVRMWLGERFAGEPVVRDPRGIDKFALAGPRRETPVVGRSGAPTSFARVEAPGTYVIGYRSKQSLNTLDARRFEAYLREEGLERIAVDRAQRGESDHPGREAYSRCAKSIVTVGKNRDGHDRVLGFPLELTPVEHPGALQPGKDATIRLVYEGEPLVGATIVAVHRGEPGRLRKAATDARGLATFKITHAGAWLFTSVHMVRADGMADADWESFWASLTLEVGESAALGDTAP